MRRKEQAAKRKAVETGAQDAEKGGKAKRQRMWWEDDTTAGKGDDGAGGARLAGDEVNDAEYYKEEVDFLATRECRWRAL